MASDPLLPETYILPELAVAALASVVLVVCLYNFFKYKDVMSFSYTIPLLYLSTLYVWIDIVQPDDLTRRVLVRIGLVALILIIGLWRVVYIMHQRQIRPPKKHRR